MFSTVNYIMVNVSDMKKSVEFYRDRLGLPLKFESPDWSEFSTGTSTLALHGGGAPNSSPKGPPQAGTCMLGFSVTNLDQTYQTLRERGVQFVMPPTPRPAEKIKLAVCVDPDGLAISIAEPLH